MLSYYEELPRPIPAKRHTRRDSDTTSPSGVILGFMDNSFGVTIQTMVRFLSENGEEAIEIRIAAFQRADKVICEIESELSLPKKITTGLEKIRSIRMEPIRQAAVRLLQKKRPEPKSTPYPRCAGA